MNTSSAACRSCSQLVRTNQKYQYLMASLTHEVRNPLTLIYSSLPLIEQACPDLSDTTLWGQLKQDVSDTIHLLRALSAPEQSDTALKQSTDLSCLLEKLALSCRPYLSSRHVALTISVPDDLPPLLCCRAQIKEALLNLLLNACDAAAERDQDGMVVLRACIEDGQIALHVRDNGPGIPEAYRASIFRAFETHKAAGTGIGLSVIRQVAQAHGGEVTLETSCLPPETFTDFCIRLPLA